MSQAEASGTASERVSEVPVLFPENASVQEAFEDIAAALIADPVSISKIGSCRSDNFIIPAGKGHNKRQPVGCFMRFDYKNRD